MKLFQLKPQEVEALSCRHHSLALRKKKAKAKVTNIYIYRNIVYLQWCVAARVRSTFTKTRDFNKSLYGLVARDIGALNKCMDEKLTNCGFLRFFQDACIKIKVIVLLFPKNCFAYMYFRSAKTMQG